MTAYPNMTREERGAEYTRVRQEFELWKAKGLKLNMARGKPGKQQLDLVSDIFSLMQDPQDYVSDGIDVRNYGELSGLPAPKRLFARDSRLSARAGVCGRQCQPAANVRYDLQGLHPWPAPQSPALVQGREHQMALPCSWL